jgi:hypothetical protein
MKVPFLMGTIVFNPNPRFPVYDTRQSKYSEQVIRERGLTQMTRRPRSPTGIPACCPRGGFEHLLPMGHVLGSHEYCIILRTCIQRQ